MIYKCVKLFIFTLGTISPTKSTSSSVATLRDGTDASIAGSLSTSQSQTALLQSQTALLHQEVAPLPISSNSNANNVPHYTLSLPLRMSSKELGEKE